MTTPAPHDTPPIAQRLLFLACLWAFAWLLYAVGVPRAAHVIDRVRAVRVVFVPLMTLGILSLTIALVGTTIEQAGIRARPRAWPAAIRRLAGIGAVAGGVLLAAELALRLSGFPPYLYQTNQPLGGFIRADFDGTYHTSNFVMHVRTNDQGLRNPAPADAATAARRVLVVGDSFTFGWGVNNDQTFVARLQDELHGDGIAVMGAGMPGFGTGQETLLMRQLAPGFRPNVVVLSFTLNDFLDNFGRQGLFPIEDGRIGSNETLSRSKRIRVWIRQHVILVNPVWDFITIKRGKGDNAPAQFRDFASLIFEPPDAVRADSRYQLTLRYVDAFAAEARSLGATPVIMVNGDRHVAVPADMERLRAESAPPGTTGDSRPFVALLDDDLRARGLAVIDTTPALAAASAQAPVYFAYHSDDHWNPRGHAVAADVVAGALRSLP